MYRTLTTVVTLAVIGTFSVAAAQGRESFDGFKLVDKTGNISKPADYRDMYPVLHSK